MPSSRYLCCLLLLIAFLFSGCSYRPVRHLASDASLITIGKSTKNDVLTYLGEPDTQRTVSANTEQWIYLEEDKSFFQKVPFLGKSFDPDGYGMIQVTFNGDIVSDCQFTSYNKDEFDWSKDFNWQEKKN